MSFSTLQVRKLTIEALVHLQRRDEPPAVYLYHSQGLRASSLTPTIEAQVDAPGPTHNTSAAPRSQTLAFSQEASDHFIDGNV
jgi:hypothetical protein